MKWMKHRYFVLDLISLLIIMDILTARNVIEDFLKGLRKDGSLLTEEEFSKLDKKQYIRKEHQIGRIQGKNFIEKLVKENDLKHIKVPLSLTLQKLKTLIINTLIF